MRTIWLASYPKSGNTWMRMLIGALSVPDGTQIDINNLAERSGMASARSAFEHHTFLESGLLTHDEADRLRPAVHRVARDSAFDDEETAANALPLRLLKTHDAYTYLPNGEALLGGRQGADAAVLIVRDPRDVAPSLANHNGCDIDRAITLMGDPLYCFSDTPNRQTFQLRQKLLGWSGYSASWLDQTDLPVLLVRYEEMKADTAAVLERVLEFCGEQLPRDKIERAVALTRFEDLQKLEAEVGFGEKPPHRKSDKFFRRGEAGAWRDELSASQVQRVEQDHAVMMQRLGYGLASQQSAEQKAVATE